MTDKKLALKFGKILKDHRKAAGLTQEKLAELVGITPEHIQRLEGKNPCGIRLETIVKLSQSLGIKTSTLLKSL